MVGDLLYKKYFVDAKCVTTAESALVLSHTWRRARDFIVVKKKLPGFEKSVILGQESAILGENWAFWAKFSGSTRCFGEILDLRGGSTSEPAEALVSIWLPLGTARLAITTITRRHVPVI